MTVTLPAELVRALHLTEHDRFMIDTAGDQIVLRRATPDFQDAWAAYQSIEPRYRNANKKLAE